MAGVLTPDRRRAGMDGESATARGMKAVAGSPPPRGRKGGRDEGAHAGRNFVPGGAKTE